MSRLAIPTSVPGQYIVNGSLWSVGERYKVHEFVGRGAYGEVCRATDFNLNVEVALKKVPDILGHPVLAKRILREVCIMRRLKHPYILSLTDAFGTQQQDGALDLYMATEFAHGGDMFHFRETLTPEQVKSLMWQMLLAVNYMHLCRVWHRDIKSDNILLTSSFRVKICDFGLARSAEENPVDDIPTTSRKKVLTRQYTKEVVTVNYRAPEVIMSQGEYNSAIDIWSLGCVFWELLMRSVGDHGFFQGLFSIRDTPDTPREGESYVEDGLSPLAKKLDIIFDVIGTPCWKDIESVPSESWRRYLKHLRGRAGNLAVNLVGHVDNEAIDLLYRMLEFNPSRRCTAEEALAHVYFKDMKRPSDTRQLLAESPASALSTGAVWSIKDPSVALERLEMQLENAGHNENYRHILMAILVDEIHQQTMQDLIRQAFLGSFVAAKREFMSMVDKEENYRETAQSVHGVGEGDGDETTLSHPAPGSIRRKRKPSVQFKDMVSSKVSYDSLPSYHLAMHGVVEGVSIVEVRGHKSRWDLDCRISW